MQSFSKRKSQILKTKPLDFSSNLRELIAESRKCQTLYVNCEGSHKRRRFNARGENDLESYIFNTLYSGTDKYWGSESDRKKIEHVKSISEAIISISKGYNVRNIECTVVWVYVCEPQTKSLNAVPVFKVFKKPDGNSATFLDVNLVQYECCYEYLNEAKFPGSLLCFPRHGEYNFDADEQKLDLEFLIVNPCSTGGKAFFTFRPFCVNVIQPIINGIKKSKKLWEDINMACKMLQDVLMKNIGNVALIVVFIAALLFRPSLMFEEISNLTIMLFTIKASLAKKEIEALGSVTATNSSKMTRDFMKPSPDGELEKKDWRKNLKAICDLYGESKPIFKEFCTSPKILKFANLVDFLISVLRNSSILNPSEDEKKIVSMLENPSKELKIYGNQSPRVQELGDLSTTNEVVDFLSLLDLESGSVKNHEKKVVASLASSDLLVEEEYETFKLIFTSVISVPMMIDTIHRVLGENFTLRPAKNNIIHVVNFPVGNQNLGTLFFKTERELFIVKPKKAVPPLSCETKGETKHWAKPNS